MKKIVIVILCLAMFGSANIVTATANSSNEASLQFDNVMFVDSLFAISETGTADIWVSYYGYQGITTGGIITTKLQKQNGTSWDDIEEWEEEAVGDVYSKEYVVQLTERGTYRVQIEYVIQGTDGPDDVINEEMVRTY